MVEIGVYMVLIDAVLAIIEYPFCTVMSLVVFGCFLLKYMDERKAFIWGFTFRSIQNACSPNLALHADVSFHFSISFYLFCSRFCLSLLRST